MLLFLLNIKEENHNKMIIPFEEFERAVMAKLLEEENSINRILREQYKNSEIISREFTGAGFFTKLKIPPHIPLVNEPVDYGYGNLWCCINDKEFLHGFVLFIKDGVMICLEGFTCADSWPEIITSFEFMPN